MPTKEQLEEELNETLGTDIEWSRLKKDDLQLLVDSAGTGRLMEPLAKEFVKDKGKDKLEEEVDGWHLGKYAMRLL